MHVPIFDSAELWVSLLAVAEPVHRSLRALTELAAYYVQIRQTLPLHLSTQLQRCSTNTDKGRKGDELRKNERKEEGM